jgi:hypothetical protein
LLFRGASYSALPAGIGLDDGQAERLEVADEGSQPPFVIEPGSVVVELLVAEDAGQGLGFDLARPLVIGPVQRRRIAVAATVRMPAARQALGQGAGQHEPYAAERLSDALELGTLRSCRPHHLSFPAGIHHLVHFSQYIYCMTSRDEVRRAISGFSPKSVPCEAAGFARAVVSSAAPPNKARAKALLFAASRLGAFGLSCGLEMSAETLLHPSVIERFCVRGLSKVSGASRRTVRTNLRYLARRVIGTGPGPAPLSRERAKAPYEEAEIAAYLALADAQPTLSRRMRASALICLGAGAGLMGADLRSVRGTDVVCRSGGVIVVVAGRRPRSVPVRSIFHRRLLSAAAFAGIDYVIGGSDPDRRNVTYPLTSSLAGGRDLAPLDTGRLRATWLVDCASSLGLKAFMEAAGIVCSQRLGDLVAHLENLDEPEAVELLGGRS